MKISKPNHVKLLGQLFMLCSILLGLRSWAQVPTYTNSSLADVLRYENAQRDIQNSQRQNYSNSSSNTNYEHYYTPTELAQIEERKRRNNLPSIYKAENGKYGTKNAYGQIFIKPTYDDMVDFYNGYYGVKKDGKWGAINGEEHLFVDYKYDRMYCALHSVRVSLNGSWGVLDPFTGKEVISPQFDEMIGSGVENLMLVKQGNKWGIIDQSGHIILRPQFDEIYNGYPGLYTKLNGKMGYVGPNGNPVILPAYDYIVPGDPFVVTLNKKWGYCNQYGNVLGSINYDMVSGFLFGLGKVAIGTKYGYVDMNGQVVIPIVYDQIETKYGKFYTVEKNGKWGMIDRQMKQRVPMEFDNLGLFDVMGYADASLNGKCGQIDSTGKETVPLKYDYFKSFGTCPSLASINGKWGLINPWGTELTPIKYDTLDYNGFEFNLVKTGMVDKSSGKMKWGFVDTWGKIAIPIKYDQVEYLNQYDCALSIGMMRTEYVWDFENYKWKKKSGDK